jgi:hypothetical protein
MSRQHKASHRNPKNRLVEESSVTGIAVIRRLAAPTFVIAGVSMAASSPPLFWYGVTLAYFGLAVGLAECIWDPYFVNARYQRQVLAIGTVLFVFVIFTIGMVGRRSQIEFSYLVNGTRLGLIVSNNSTGDDYRNLDLTIIPEPENGDSVIGSFQELTPGTPCSVISSAYQITGYPTLVMATPTGYASYPSAIRLRCESLPHRDIAEFEIQLVKRIVRNGQNAVVPVMPTGNPEFKIRFTGKFRNIDIGGRFDRER